MSNSKRKKKAADRKQGVSNSKNKTKTYAFFFLATPSSSSRQQLRLLRENSSLQAAVRDRCVAAGARRRRLCRCVAARGRRGCVRVRLRVSRLGARVGCGRDAIFRHPAITATTAMAMAAVMAPPSQTRNATAIRWRFFEIPPRKTAMAPTWPPFNNTDW